MKKRLRIPILISFITWALGTSLPVRAVTPPRLDSECVIQNIQASLDRRQAKPGNLSSGDSPARAALKNAYLSRDFANEAENTRWIQLALDERASSNRLFLDVENSAMKRLNDTLKDFNLVTAMNNLYNESLGSRIRDLASKHGVRAFPYSDHKSMRFVFEGAISENFRRELSELFERVNREYADGLSKRGVLRAGEDNGRAWFHAGIGARADEANMAARHSRKLSGEPKLRDFSDPRVQRNLTGAFGFSEQLQASFGTAFARTGLTERSPSGKSIPSRNVFDLVRKHSDDTDLRTALMKLARESKGSPDGITDQAVSDLRRYVDLVDEFSPGLRIAKREAANLLDASHGGVSLDFVGMGAENLHATALALSSANDVASAIRFARKNELDVSYAFRMERLKIKKLFQEFKTPSGEPFFEVICSGDDCVAKASAPMSQALREQVMKALTLSRARPSLLRTAFVPEGVASRNDRDLISKHGEALEKKLRSMLSKQFPNPVLNRLSIGVDMQGRSASQGGVRLLLGRDVAQGVEREATQAFSGSLEKTFEEAILLLNQDLSAQGFPTQYRPEGISVLDVRSSQR